MSAPANLRLSPYCVFWQSPDGQVLNVVHGLHGSRFELSIELLPAIAAFASGASAELAYALLPSGAGEVVEALVSEAVLVPADRADEPGLFANRLDPLELAFHRGLNEGGYDAARLEGPPPPPASQARPDALALPLPVHSDGCASLVDALNSRASRRDFSATPVAHETLARFLALTARARALREVEGLGWVSTRNYPSAGARYPLELYLVVENVERVPNGIYHYHPFTHRLEPVASEAEHRSQVIEMAKLRLPVGSRGRPGVVIIVTAAVARTSWKYRGMPYHAILMETGALYQTMSLVAGAVDLAASPVGAFPEIALAALLGLDSRDEAAVGLFAIGTAEPVVSPALVVAVRTVDDSLFDGARGEVVEMKFADGTRLVAPADELDLHERSNGEVACAIRGRTPHATIDPVCLADALRLIPRRAPRPD